MPHPSRSRRAPPSHGQSVDSAGQLAGHSIGAGASDRREFVASGEKSRITDLIWKLAKVGEEILWVERPGGLAF